MPDFDYMLKAKFEQPKIIAKTDGHGTVKIGDKIGEEVETIVQYGGDITIVPTPYDGWEFDYAGGGNHSYVFRHRCGQRFCRQSGHRDHCQFVHGAFYEPGHV